MNSTTATHAASPSAQSGASDSTCATLGTIACRVVIPGWLALGAIFKLSEMNPKLLPPVILSMVESIASNLNVPITNAYDPALRVIIAAELALALIMVLAPRISRFVAVGVMGLFCALLVQILLAKGSSCGCFGSNGPHPGVMLGIDASLLACAIFLPTRRSYMKCVPTLMVIIGATVVSSAVAFAVPGRGAVTIVTPPQETQPPVNPPAKLPDPPSNTKPADPPANPPPTNPPPTNPPPTNPPPANPPAANPPATPEVKPWPPMPGTIQPYYNFEPKEWLGKRLDSQEMALLMTSTPINPNSGRLHLVFMREDCEHCHKLLETYFGGKLQTPALTITIPDATGTPKSNPCKECAKTSLVKVGTAPIYMITTPVLMTVKDGVVISICADTEKDEEVRKTLDAGK